MRIQTTQERVACLLRAPSFERAVVALIVTNAALLGLDTYDTVHERYGHVIGLIDRLILSVFVVELALRLYVARLAFFRDPWSVFDLLVVGVALLPAAGPLSVLRALRILRALRLITAIPSMRRVVGGLIEALPGMGSIVALLALIFYVGAVMATELYGDRFPEWFGTLGRSAYTLFQIMTLESWSMGIARPVMDVYPWAWVFFITFIVVTSFAVLNLFIGIIVNAMQKEHEELLEAERQKRDDELQQILAELRALRRELRELAERR
jgi:voltage-gated sodium channel